MAPAARDLDRSEEVAWPYVELFCRHEHFALPSPSEHGGVSALTFNVAVEVLSKADASAGLILAAQALGSYSIVLAGTEGL